MLLRVLFFLSKIFKNTLTVCPKISQPFRKRFGCPLAQSCYLLLGRS